MALTRSTVTFFWAIFVVTVNAQDQSQCIQTPEEYIDAFTNYLPAECVDTSLYVTLQGPCSCSLNPNECSATASEYANNEFAWLSGSENLEVYLDLNNQYPNDTWAAVSAMLDYVGFEDSYIDPSCTYRMAVMERENLVDSDLFAPSFVAWWEQTLDRFGVALEPDVEKEVTLYGFSQFDSMTGCSDRNTEPAGACGEEFEETRTLIEPARNSDGTSGCLQAFGAFYNGGFSANAANARAMLYICYGANGLFTGTGYGFDGSNYTDAEFVIENKLLEEELGATIYQLYPVNS